jgi:hypothetical protein
VLLKYLCGHYKTQLPTVEVGSISILLSAKRDFSGLPSVVATVFQN